jgi:DNA-binding PadR family transcriptional regulator
MFDNDGIGRPAFGWAGSFGPGGYEGWQPWARRPRGIPWGPQLGARLWRMGRQFPFGPGFGPGRPGPGPRMFGRGDLKYALLDLLRERPKHGYEMIKELEDRSGGFYTPSAGAIYPTLQLLEDRGWVTVDTQEGKKVYQMTDGGKAALAEQQERGEGFGRWGFWGEGEHGPHSRHGPGGPFGPGAFGRREIRPELRALRHESLEVARLMRAAVLASDGNPERLARLRAIVQRTRTDLDAFLGQGGGPSGPVENL